MSELKCPNCGNIYVTYSPQQFKNGVTHTRADCMKCDTFIKYVPQTDDEFLMPFGKHKGKALNEIPASYLRWGAENLHGNVQLRFKRALKFEN